MYLLCVLVYFLFRKHQYYILTFNARKFNIRSVLMLPRSVATVVSSSLKRSVNEVTLYLKG